ncbi:MAG: ABC transporter substrate-binding protein [Syntrophorhabdus sp.]
MRMATATKIIVAIVFPALIFFIITCSNTPRQVEKVVVGVETVPHTSPVWIAENRSYFQKEGLNVEIREFESGRTALQTMLSGEDIDIVTAAQTPVISHSFTRNDYAIIGNMVCAYDDVKILVRRDRGIEEPMDLKRKSVGITAGSSGHFFLSLFLAHHQLTLADVKTIDKEATKLPQALADGQVDAIATWEPHIYKAKKALGEKAFTLPSSGIYREDFYLIVRKDIVKDKPNTIKRFLRAIQRSEDFLQQKNTEAMDIVAQRLSLDKDIMKTVWSDFRFRLFLDQTLLIALEDEARWAIRNKLTDVKKVPNYLNYIYADALKEVSPAAVSIACRRD